MAGTDERWIVIPRWDEFQHPDVARSTVPPWIKSYTKLLSDETYLGLTTSQRGILHGLWMAYATYRQVLSEASARRTIVRSCGDARHWKRNIEALNHAGLIHISASRPASRPASLEVEKKRKDLTRARAKNNPQTVDNPLSPRTNVQARDPVAAIRTMIRNGVITDRHDLESELAGYGLNGNAADELLDQLDADELDADHNDT